jgi:hypothetical protein
MKQVATSEPLDIRFLFAYIEVGVSSQTAGTSATIVMLAFAGVILMVAPAKVCSLSKSSCNCRSGSETAPTSLGFTEKRYPFTLMTSIESFKAILPSISTEGASLPASYLPMIWRDFPMASARSTWLKPAFFLASLICDPSECFQDCKLWLASTCAHLWKNSFIFVDKIDYVNYCLHISNRVTTFVVI